MSSSRALLPVRRVLAVAGAALLMGVGLATPAAAQASLHPTAAGVTDLSAGRPGTIVPLVAGLISMALGVLVATTAEGGIGTGNGLGGAIVALVVGLIALILGGLTLTRARRTD